MFNILITCKLFVGYISLKGLFMDHFFKKLTLILDFFFILFYKNYHLVLDDQTSIIRFITISMDSQ